jgi:hypothetical protein
VNSSYGTKDASSVLCLPSTHFITKYYHSDCVILAFKHTLEDDTNRDRTILEQSTVMQDHIG